MSACRQRLLAQQPGGVTVSGTRKQTSNWKQWYEVATDRKTATEALIRMVEIHNKRKSVAPALHPEVLVAEVLLMDATGSLPGAL